MANSKDANTLKTRLGLSDDSLELLNGLSAGDQKKLCANVLAAESEQGERVNQAIEGAVRFWPAPLRRRVRKLLFD